MSTVQAFLKYRLKSLKRQEHECEKMAVWGTPKKARIYNLLFIIWNFSSLIWPLFGTILFFNTSNGCLLCSCKRSPETSCLLDCSDMVGNKVFLQPVLRSLTLKSIIVCLQTPNSTLAVANDHKLIIQCMQNTFRHSPKSNFTLFRFTRNFEATPKNPHFWYF